jgi:DNA polymerase III delta prime subunit
MKEPFINKYKPYYIKDFKLNKHTEGALQTFLKMDDINLLLYGNMGCGKTMLLESIVREYYGLSPNDSFPEYNIMYINNLREQGIGFYRNEMKTFCQSQSIIYGKKKMIMIDDIDNVNEQSQQVFRNYIDSYKKNIHFVSVCTNMQKVIESIQSRVHILQIRPLTIPEIKLHMDYIIKQENMNVHYDCKQYLLSVCNNSVRVMINYLEKLWLLNQPITVELCKQTCSYMSTQHFDNYLQAFKKNDLKKAIQILQQLYDSGYSVIDIFDFFFTFLKSTSVVDEETKYKIIPYLCKYITIFHTIHEDAIELCLFTNSIFQDISQ